MSAKLIDLVASSPAKDIEKNARALMAQGLSKLELVSYEEFDAQAQQLSNMQEKLRTLEARVAALENKIN